jgi:hypothetical protein
VRFVLVFAADGGEHENKQKDKGKDASYENPCSSTGLIPPEAERTVNGPYNRPLAPA